MIELHCIQYRVAAGLLLCLLSWGSARADIRVVDDDGQMLVLDRPAGRIVSLAPHITELLFAAGAGAALVGVSEHSDYPPAARDIARVGGGSGLDLEAILAMRPDLVVAWGSGSPPGQLQQLRRMGIPVFVSEPRVLSDIGGSMERLGRLAGHEAQAAEAARDFGERLHRLRQRHAGRAPVHVFYQVWQQPLMTVNGEHLVSDVIRLCGGTNIFAGLPALAPPVAIEAVLQRDPEVIIAGGEAGERAALTGYWQRWPNIRAVREGHLYIVPQDRLVRHTPRILDGAETLCDILDSVREARGS